MNQKSILTINPSTIHLWTFVFVAILIMYVYNIFEFITWPPFGKHTWRATNGLSICLGYLDNNFNFWEPQVNNMLVNDRRATGEFPIIYYFTAFLWKQFGIKFYFLRIINFSILLSGLFALSKLILHHTQSVLLAIAIAFFLFCQDLFAFYSFGYLPNTAALGINLWACYFIYNAWQKKSNKLIFLSALFFLLAGSIKTSSAILPLSLIGGAIFQFNKIKERGLLKPLLISACLYILAMISWYLWLKNYNTSYSGSWIFLFKPLHFWSYPTEEFLIHSTFLSRFLPAKIFYRLSLQAFMLMLLFNLIKIKKASFLITVLIFALLGSATYVLLFFGAFKDNHYYFIECLFIFPLTLLAFHEILKSLKFIKSPNLILTAIILIIFAFECPKAYERIYSLHIKEHPIAAEQSPDFFKYEELQSYILEIGIKKEDKILCLPDITPNRSLTFMNRVGYTHMNIEPYNENSILKLVNDKDVKYLVVYEEAINQDPFIKPFIKFPIGKFGNDITFYDLRSYKTK